MSNTNTAVEIAQHVEVTPPAEFSAFGSIQHFTDAQRMAKALSTSSIVPETYRGEARIGDCIIALEIANRIGASVLAVMQNLYIVYGRPAWSSQFLISCVNASRKFTPLRYKMIGVKGQDDWGCIAWASDRRGEVLESPEVNIAMAKAEGWYQKNGSKWKTMPELMLRYRAATLFARLYAPELTMGIQSDDEVIDISPVVTETVRASTQPVFGKTKPVAEIEAPAEAAQPKADAESPTAARVVEEIISNKGKVSFDDFSDWLLTTSGVNLAEKGIASFAELTEEIAAPLAKDKATMKKCVSIYGAK